MEHEKAEKKIRKGLRSFFDSGRAMSGLAAVCGAAAVVILVYILSLFLF